MAYGALALRSSLRLRSGQAFENLRTSGKKCVRRRDDDAAEGAALIIVPLRTLFAGLP